MLKELTRRYVTFMDFTALLKRAGLNKRELADNLGITPTTVSEWGSNPPKYATAYVELLIEVNRYRP